MIQVTFTHALKGTKKIPFQTESERSKTGLCGFSLSNQLTQCRAVLTGHVQTTEMGKRG